MRMLKERLSFILMGINPFFSFSTKKPGHK